MLFVEHVYNSYITLPSAINNSLYPSIGCPCP